MIIVVVSVLFTNNLARSLQVEEQKNMAIWAEATQQLILADENADIDFVSSIIEKNTTIPVYICDADGNVLASRNVKESLMADGRMLKASNHHGPIELKIDHATTQYIYWDDSRLLTNLRIVPYAQFALIFIFIAIAVVVMLTSQRSEQNRLWVGLSKETAHQLGTPISSLNAWQQLLADKYPSDEYVPQMKRDIERLQIIADRFQKIGILQRVMKQCRTRRVLIIHLFSHMHHVHKIRPPCFVLLAMMSRIRNVYSLVHKLSVDHDFARNASISRVRVLILRATNNTKPVSMFVNRPAISDTKFMCISLNAIPASVSPPAIGKHTHIITITAMSHNIVSVSA